MSNSRVLLTGSTGYLAQAFMPRILQVAPVRALVRQEYQREHFRPLSKLLPNMDLDFHVADATDNKALAGATTQCESVVHMIFPSLKDVKDPQEIGDTIVKSAENIVSQVKQTGHAKHITMASCMSVYGARWEDTHLVNPIEEVAPLEKFGHPIADALIEAEEVFAAAREKQKLSVTILRLGNVYGPGAVQFTDSLIKMGMEHKQLTYAEGDGVMRYLQIESAIDAIEMSLSMRPNMALNIFDGVTTQRGYLEAIARIFEGEIELKELSKQAAKDAALAHQKIFSPSQMDALLKSASEPITEIKLSAKAERAEEALMWEPRLTLDEGMQGIQRFYFKGEAQKMTEMLEQMK